MVLNVHFTYIISTCTLKYENDWQRNAHVCSLYLYSVEKGEGEENECKHKLPVSVRKSKKLIFCSPRTARQTEVSKTSKTGEKRYEYIKLSYTSWVVFSMPLNFITLHTSLGVFVDDVRWSRHWAQEMNVQRWESFPDYNGMAVCSQLLVCCFTQEEKKTS